MNRIERSASRRKAGRLALDILHGAQKMRAATIQGETHMQAIPDERITDERVTCLRIFADANGESHMEDVDIGLQPRKLFEDNPSLPLSDNLAVSWCNFCHLPAGVREVDWHNPPQRLLVLWLTGEVEFETSDGNIRRLPAGSVVLAEDTTGKGHISRHPLEGQLVAHIALA
jgi:sugar phosphate isomerase/epimerase